MSRRILILNIVAVLFSLSFVGGCGKPTAESVSSDMTARMNEVVDVLKTVKDESSAKSAAEKIKTIAEAAKKIEEQAKALPDAEKKLLEEKKTKQMETIGTALSKEMQRIMIVDPKLMAIVSDAMQNMAK